MSVAQITSDSLLIDTEHHFRVYAGPGAGKTHWLIEHIKNVLHRSKRLAKSRKIVCITYTNIGVETILERLGTSANQVEVSTIHSFLYKNVVKPYASFIASEYGLNVAEMDGHDEHIVSSRKLISWIQNHPQKNNLANPYSVNQLIGVVNFRNAIQRWIASINYKIDISGNIVLSSDRKESYYVENGDRKYIGRRCIDTLEAGLLEYKKLYWNYGRIHHEDVLFFSYQIIQNYPFVLEVLRAKFPYFFIDEFQDSNPIQVAILKFIAQNETIVGIVGDKAQSIYGFQGADPSQFHSFNLTGIEDYEIVENRRSTNEIISLLNNVRKDIIQIPHRNIKGERSVIIVGPMNNALEKAYELCGSNNVFSLSRDNITSNSMKRDINGIGLDRDIIDKLRAVDSNPDRKRCIIAFLKSIEYAREKKYKDAIKELESVFHDSNDKQKGKKEALKYLYIMLSKYDEYRNGYLYDFYSIIKRDIRNDIANLVNRGGIKPFYEQHTYQEFAICINIPEDISHHKTIHKAKGDEFENVLLVLKNEIDLKFILNPDIQTPDNAGEEQRINYVAISRTIDRLFISVPTLQQINQTKMESRFQIINV